MLGSIFGAGLRIINIPVKLGESAVDIIAGGDGSRQSKESVSPVVPSKILDGIADRVESRDDHSL